jgi:cytolysin (calcineurin-like family phosphatase)
MANTILIDAALAMRLRTGIRRSLTGGKLRLKWLRPLALTSLLLGVFSFSVQASYPDVKVTNITPYTANVAVHYASSSCKQDSFTVAPGRTQGASRGACLISEIDADLGVGHPATPASYGSSGTSYSNFIIEAEGSPLSNVFRVWSDHEIANIPVSVQQNLPKTCAAANDPAGFYMILIGDTEFPRALITNPNLAETRSNLDAGCEGTPLPLLCEDSTGSYPNLNGATPSYNQARVNNVNYVASITQEIDKYGQGNVCGVIAHGDLTEFGSQTTAGQAEDDLHLFQLLYNFPVTLYPGLGNHDLTNNLDPTTGCSVPQDRCALPMVNYLREAGVAATTTNPSDPGLFDPNSLAYSWNIGSFHFVQLNNFPTFGVDIDSVNLEPATMTSTTSWLMKDLTKAASEGKYVILNYHDPYDYWGCKSWLNCDPPSTFKTVLSAMAPYVSAVFVGHFHSEIGPPSAAVEAELQASGMYGSVPVFFTGSSIYNKYLIVQFKPGSMHLKSVDSSEAATGNPQVSTETDLGVFPISIPK